MPTDGLSEVLTYSSNIFFKYDFNIKYANNILQKMTLLTVNFFMKPFESLYKTK